MKDERAKILENTLIAADTYRMVLQSSLCEDLKAGQFVNHTRFCTRCWEKAHRRWRK